MHPRQVFSFINKRVFRFSSETTTPEVSSNQYVIDTEFLVPDSSQDMENGVSFLNCYDRFYYKKVSWRKPNQQKLWRYNLHYFDYLLWPNVTIDRKSDLIDSWIDKNPVGTEDAWEPYTVSLRIVNWIKYFQSLCDQQSIPKHWLDSLSLQAAWLSKNLETHILANHYLKNAKALVFAGAYFDGDHAAEWSDSGITIFSEQMKEQFLASGAHYELSTMYHCICLEDLLDVVNITTNNSRTESDEWIRDAVDTARRGLDFLHNILLPDGRIPLFNDSAFSIAPSPEDLFDYAQRLFGYENPQQTTESYTDAGYFVLGKDNDRMVIDCGPISPSYQPGHTHCDMLSYELSVSGQHVIVDTGVFNYVNSKERQYCRSTKAHNTVVVDDEEQSEIWSVFRVARRAKVISSHFTSYGNGSGCAFKGEIHAFPRVKGRIHHKRSVEFDSNNYTWLVSDSITGSGTHRIESYIHLHPGMEVEMDGSCVLVLNEDKKSLIKICSENDIHFEKTSGWYFPEFGKKHENTVLKLSVETGLPFSFGYRIERI